MGNTYNILLHHTLTLLHQEARLAYWKNEKHCGSDFDPQSACCDCQHFSICEAQLKVTAGLELLDQMDGD